VIDHGRPVFRHDQEKGSALKIIEYLIARKKPVTLDIQREMVDQNLEVLDTGAGSELASAVETLIKHYEEKLKKLEQEIIEAHDSNKKEDREIVEEPKKENQERLAKQQQEILNLQIGAEQMTEAAKKRAEKT
jgi:septal ring factor EnvC (AmiA/AmiB activator)